VFEGGYPPSDTAGYILPYRSFIIRIMFFCGLWRKGGGKWGD
jgi:hypothetical protein